MTDEDLKKVYHDAFGASYASGIYVASNAGLRAIYERGLRDGARAQRDMEPTEAMLSAGYNKFADAHGIFVAMQRAAPLAAGGE